MSLQASEAGGVLRLVLDRPAQRNALSLALLAALRQALRTATDSARVVVLSGGAQCFSAGADFADLKGTPEDIAFDEAVGETAAALMGARVPVIAAIEGPCIGAALELALSCDVRIASQSAFFELPSVRLGILYNPAALQRMRAMLPRETLTRVLLLGERLDGHAAMQAGLVTRLVAEGEADKSAGALAAQLATCPQSALAATKQLLRALDAGDDMAKWLDLRSTLLGSEERGAALQRARRKRGA